MKAKEKLTMIFAIATIAVLAAAQSVNQAGGENLRIKAAVKPVRGYTEDDIELLMQANRWSHQQATQSMELAEKAASVPTHQ